MDRRRILKTAGVAALAVLGGWLGLWLLGPVLLPFGVGYLFALGAQPAVDTLTKRHIPRWAAAGLTVTLLYAALGTAFYALGWVLCRETLALARQLPELAESLTGPAARVEAWLLERADRFPDGVGQALRQGVEEFFRSGAGLAGRAYNWVFGLISGALKKLPELMLFLVKWLLSVLPMAQSVAAWNEVYASRLPVDAACILFVLCALMVNGSTGGLRNRKKRV